MLNVISADGTDVRAHDEGRGPVIVLLHPGLDDGTGLKEVAAILAGRFRVIRPHRRQYRLDLKADPRLGGSPCSVAEEVDDVLAVVRAVEVPVVLYGHSDGAVTALETLAAAPDLFAGAVIYEPPAVIGPPLGGADGEVLARARAALAAGKTGKAMEIFLRDTVRIAAWQAWPAGKATALVPRFRRLAPCQLDSVEALDRLGVRLDTYARITVPTVLLSGDRSPAHLSERLDAIGWVMPNAERVRWPGRDHNAHLKHPKQVAQLIQSQARKVLHLPG
ncbi:alpha/beta fold hydrolase [Nonomuraea jiangxiensis]|uniref:Pimeloyl-ACP methyl ester carboxylesterase n=1 Tax=Nonomuraea jiangxiensis TaxID=633440 RepID=A0A1G8EMT0_9ACTN|nr:alpha/beta hydrolase [Nonomuraea jiangxiensis]SDH71178.1 Pimeloyl-ACP methyl ester carboxylesterase [Nonomuraea jiangxiensis]